jgi:hypothetical protein
MKRWICRVPPQHHHWVSIHLLAWRHCLHPSISIRTPPMDADTVG